MKYYGQHELDRKIAEYFINYYVNRKPNQLFMDLLARKPDPIVKRGGLAVEVGAYDGVKGSNTKHFEEFHNWATICIEPNGKAFEKLRKNRPNSLNYNYACASSAGMREFTIVKMKSGIESSLSSLELDPRLVDEYGHDIKSQRKITAECATLNNIMHQTLAKHTFPGFAIDFVSIDTEGTELDVLKGFSLDYWKPKLLVIENNYEDKEISEYLKGFGYRHNQRHHVNDIYVRGYDL